MRLDGKLAYIHGRSIRRVQWGYRNKMRVETPLVILARCRVRIAPAPPSGF